MTTNAPGPAVSVTEAAALFQRNTDILKRQAAGLSHEDSLLQPQPNGNCMNWIFGHMAGSRDGVLELLGAEPVLDEAARQRYARGSAPVTADGPDILKLDRLVDVLGQQLDRITTALSTVSADRLTEVWSPENGTTVGSRLLFLLWHDTYHVGQTDQLRQLTGVNDQVIP